jgi:hypothetical protein
MALLGATVEISELFGPDSVLTYWAVYAASRLRYAMHSNTVLAFSDLLIVD